MKVLFLGDVVGRSGREVVLRRLPELRRQLALDFVVVNGENAAAGFGLTAKIADAFFDAGADIITTGNHVWDRKEMIDHIVDEPRLLRPLNLPPGAPGRGLADVLTDDGRRVVVAQAMGQLFMDPLDNPFTKLDEALADIELGHNADCVLVDFHADITSEKMAMGQFLNGRASLVVGSHSHVPTADTQILSAGTAYQTDAGMCGDYDSIIGMEITEPLRRFTTKMRDGPFTAAAGPATLCGTYIETDDQTGQAVQAAPIRLEGRLAEQWPV